MIELRTLSVLVAAAVGAAGDGARAEATVEVHKWMAKYVTAPSTEVARRDEGPDSGNRF